MVMRIPFAIDQSCKDKIVHIHNGLFLLFHSSILYLFEGISILDCGKTAYIWRRRALNSGATHYCRCSTRSNRISYRVGCATWFSNRKNDAFFPAVLGF